MSESKRAIVNPIEVISAARHHIATLAAIRAAAKGLIPSAAAIMLTVSFTAIGNLTWSRWGYLLSGEVADSVRTGLWAGAIAGVIVSAIAARRTFRGQAFAEAASQVDRMAAAKEEVLTLALLSDPASQRSGAERSPLYPILWRRAAEILYRFDPSTAFELHIGQSIRSGLMASLGLVVLLASFVGLAIQPITALSDAARHMQKTADTLDMSPSGAESKTLADRLRKAARALNDPSIPREDKLEQLAAISRELEERQKPQSSQTGRQQPKAKQAGNQSAKNQSGNGSGEGNGDKQGKSGSGSGGAANGAATGSEPGSGSNQAGNDQGAHDPSNKSNSNNLGNNANDQIAELSKDLQKDRQKLEAGDSSPNGQPGGGNDRKQRENASNAPRRGRDRDQSGSLKPGGGTPEGASGRPGQKDSQNTPAATGKPNGEQAPNDASGSSGDTHLGQFPSPSRFERFYKPGDKGEPVEIKDARYVLFRIPPAAALAGSGKIVMDTDRPVASTPYANAPLKDERLSATPDERQLIPPRYRDLLR